MFDSITDLAGKLAATGYFIDAVMTQVVFLAAKLQKPLLLEGPAGSGKTQLAISVAAAACTHVERLQCYRGVTEDKTIGRFDEGLQRLYMEFSKGQHEDWQSVQANLKGRDFFRPGPLMRALECERPCVLLIDELDKVDDGFEAQSFKRACSVFGLGRYFYNFAEMWVDIDAYKHPHDHPALPSWALPENERHAPVQTGAVRKETGNGADPECLENLQEASKLISATAAKLQESRGIQELPVRSLPISGIEPFPTLDAMERAMIVAAYRRSNRNSVEAAHLLGIGKTTFYRKLKEMRQVAA
jgi:hypothetical protein